MKKIIGLALLLMMVFALGACQTNDTTNSGVTTEESDEFDPIADGVLTVGMDLRWAPFETKDPVTGDPTGISVDLAYELGRYLDVKVEIVDLEFGSLIAALNTKDIDVIIASMSITEERAEAIDFSDPYFYFSLITVLNKDFQDENNIETKEELFAIDGVKYVGPRSFVALSIPEAQATNPIILEVNDATAALLEVVTGGSDAFIIDAVSASEYHMSNLTTTELLWDPIDSSPIGMGVRQTDVDSFLTTLNEFIAQLGRENGTYDRLAKLYDDVIAESLPGQGLDFYIIENEE